MASLPRVGLVDLFDFDGIAGCEQVRIELEANGQIGNKPNRPCPSAASRRPDPSKTFRGVFAGHGGRS
jgi:hypothetical protein